MNLAVLTVLCFEILNFHTYIHDVPYLSFGKYGHMEGEKERMLKHHVLLAEHWGVNHDVEYMIMYSETALWSSQK